MAEQVSWLTDPEVIERELLLAEGDVYDEARAEESMRNLRALGIFALVRIVAVTTPDPKRSGLLVYTRDLWSLRLETGFAGTGEALLPDGASQRAQLPRQEQAADARLRHGRLSLQLGRSLRRPARGSADSSRCASRST